MEIELLPALEFREETVGHLDDIDIPRIDLPPFRHADKDLDRVLDHFLDTGSRGRGLVVIVARPGFRCGSCFRHGLPAFLIRAAPGRVPLLLRHRVLLFALPDQPFAFTPVTSVLLSGRSVTPMIRCAASIIGFRRETITNWESGTVP